MGWLCAVVLIVISCLGTATVHAQSLDLSGAENKWFYGYYGQLGSRGFFGDYNLDASSTGGNFASLNAWVGNQDVNQLVTGSNAGISSFSLDITPKYGDEWVLLKARYTINPYTTSTAIGAVVPVSPGQLTLWSVQVNSPVVDIRFGKQIFQKGFSLQFSSNRTTEYLMLERNFAVPDILACLIGSGILPRRAMSWFNPEFWPRYKRTNHGKPYPYDNPEYKEPEDELYRHPEKNKSIFKVSEDERLAALEKQLADFEKCEPEDGMVGGEPAPSREDDRVVRCSELVKEKTREIEELKARITKENSDEAPAYAWGHIGPACLRIGFGFFPWETPTASVSTPLAPPYFNLWNQFDLGANPVQNFVALIAYTSTDLEFGIGCLRSVYHQGPELQPGVAARISAPTFERYVTEGWAYIKYNNGRFLFNTELDWFNRVYRFQRSLNGQFFGVNDNVDGSGSLFAAKYWESWRYMVEAGIWYGPLFGRVFYCFMPGPDRRHGVLIDRQPFIQDQFQQAFGLFDPYSFLLAYRFGSGVNAQAYIADASVYAVKLDYALASNLILEGSFLRAVRNSNGYAVGYVRPNTAAPFGTLTYAEPPGSTFTNPAPSIPERDLGWEAMVGCVWKLLEGWSVAARISYWQPGKWFNYACVDKGVPNWDIPSVANNWGIRPDRTIDPVMGLELQVGVSY